MPAVQEVVSADENWLSFLVPVYNAAPYIESCINSLLSQMRPGIEIVIVDDASTDGTSEVLRKLVASDETGAIKVWRNDTNQGVSSTRNLLLDRCSGTYVWFIDADDLMLADAVDALMRIIDTHSPDMVICDFADYHLSMTGPGGEPVHTRNFNGPERQLLRDRDTFLIGVLRSGQMYVWSRIVRRDLWGSDLRYPADRFCEDLAVTPLLTARAQTLYYEPTAWIEYRDAEDSITAKWSGKKLNDMVDGMSEITDALRNLKPEVGPDVLAAIDGFCLHQVLFCLKRMVRNRTAPDHGHVLSHCLQSMEKHRWYRNWVTRRTFNVEDLKYRLKLKKWVFRARFELLKKKFGVA